MKLKNTITKKSIPSEIALQNSLNAHQIIPMLYGILNQYFINTGNKFFPSLRKSTLIGKDSAHHFIKEYYRNPVKFVERLEKAGNQIVLDPSVFSRSGTSREKLEKLHEEVMTRLMVVFESFKFDYLHWRERVVVKVPTAVLEILDDVDEVSFNIDEEIFLKMEHSSYTLDFESPVNWHAHDDETLTTGMSFTYFSEEKAISVLLYSVSKNYYMPFSMLIPINLPVNEIIKHMQNMSFETSVANPETLQNVADALNSKTITHIINTILYVISDGALTKDEAFIEKFIMKKHLKIYQRDRIYHAGLEMVRALEMEKHEHFKTSSKTIHLRRGHYAYRYYGALTNGRRGEGHQSKRLVFMKPKIIGLKVREKLKAMNNQFEDRQ